jgi:hypothetical protein
MTNYQLAAMHIITEHLGGRGTTIDGLPEASALHAESFSSTQQVLADFAAMLADLSPGTIAAADRLDNTQWRILLEAAEIVRHGRLGAMRRNRWALFTRDELQTLAHSLSTSIGGEIHHRLEREIAEAKRNG